MTNLPEKVEQVLIAGDLSKLTAEERVMYYNGLCDSLGLNKLTKPFEYITLNGKLTLYARKDATEQLRKLYGVSIARVERVDVGEGILAFKAHASDMDNRTDEAVGAVSIQGLKGNDLANAVMKAETKAKRRVTLSICGLGMLDETELETIEVSPPAPSASVKPQASEPSIKLAGSKFFQIPDMSKAQETFLLKRGFNFDKLNNVWVAPEGLSVESSTLTKLKQYEVFPNDNIPDWDSSAMAEIELPKWNNNESLAELNTRISDLAEKKKMP